MGVLDTLIDVEASYRVLADEHGFPRHAGMQMWKSAPDLVRYRTAIEATTPAVLVETGTHTGGFAAWVADQYAGLQVITVDVNPHPQRPAAWPGVTFISGDSVAETTIRAVIDRLPRQGRVMVT